MVSGGIIKDGVSKRKVDPCGVCSLRVKANSVLCAHCGKWIHSRCFGAKSVTLNFLRHFTCIKCEGNIGEPAVQVERLCDGVETVRKFTYLCDRVSAGGGCEAAVKARERCGWVTFRVCGELLYSRRFPQKLKGAVYKSYVRPAIVWK